MLLVQASPTTLERHRHPNLGVLSSPRRIYLNVEGWRWAADNDAYSQWDPGLYQAMLDRLRELPGCLFVTAPDVVGDATKTLHLFAAWRERLEGLPVALVGQDGLSVGQVPWDELDAFFIGGTTDWKMSEDAARLGREARARGKWLHMGRVNTHQRVRYAKALGCDSIDGSSFSWFRDRWLPEFLDHAAGPTQPMLAEWAD